VAVPNPPDGRLAELACTGAPQARLQEQLGGDWGLPRYSPFSSPKACCPTHSLLNVWDSWESFESSQRRCGGAMHRRKPSAASPVSTRAVAAPEPDVLVTHLAIERAGVYDLISHPVVHDGQVRLQAPRHGHIECVSRVLLHGSRPERTAAGVTRLGPDGVFLYIDLALSSHCGFFRAFVRLARSLLEHPKLTRWSIDELVVLCVQEDHLSTSEVLSILTLSRVWTPRKGLLLATVRFKCAV